MKLSAITPPVTDPTPIFDMARMNFAAMILAAGVAHFDVFGQLAAGPLSVDELRKRIGLESRAAVVLFTGLRAMGFIVSDGLERLALSDVAREHLTPGGYFNVADYIGLESKRPAVIEFVELLRRNKPGSAVEEKNAGAAFIYRAGMDSAMEQEAAARSLTLKLAGRAKNVAPSLAAVAPLDGAATLLDMGGGTGIYSIACLQRHPKLRAIVLDRPQVLKVAAEFAEAYGVADRLELRAGDMFESPLPGADAVLLSNILHDWDIPECHKLTGRAAAAATPGGCVMIHDVFLNDDHSGPLQVALYSAALFTLTEGRAYSEAEYRAFLTAAGLTPEPIRWTLVNCGILTGRKA